MQRRPILFLALALLFALMAKLLGNGHISEEKELDSLRHGIERLSERIEAVLSEAAEGDRPLAEFASQWKTANIGLVLYEEGRAVVWTTQMLPFPATYGPRDRPQDALVRLRNGWYLCRVTEQDGQLLAAYGLVCTDYGFENRHIRNGWNSITGVTLPHKLTYAQTGTHPLSDVGGGQELRVRLSERGPVARWPVSILWVVALALMIRAIWHLTLYSEGARSTGPLFLLAVMLALLRGLMMVTGLPSGLYTTDLFGPEQYASGWLFPSLGDLLLNLICVMLVLLRAMSNGIGQVRGVPQQWGLLLLAQLAVVPTHRLFRSLVEDAAFPLDLNIPFQLTWYSIIGLLVSFVAVACWMMMVNILLRSIRPQGSIRKWLVRLALTWVVVMAMSLGDGPRLLAVCAGGAVVAMMTVHRLLWPSIRPVTLITPAVTLLTLAAMVMLQVELQRSELDTREDIAKRLEFRQDPVTEFLFKELEEAFQADRDLRNALSALPAETERALARIQRRVGFEHWNRYRTAVSIFSGDGRLLATDLTGLTPSFAGLETRFKDARPTLSAGLRFDDLMGDDGGYLGKVVFAGRRSQPDIIMFLDMSPQSVNDVPGFTDLFVDEGISLTRMMQGYSFARYRDGDLRQQGGDVRFPLTASWVGDSIVAVKCTVTDGISHLVHRPDDATLVVVSRPVRGFIPLLTTFSYLFLFYFGCAIGLSLSDREMRVFRAVGNSFRDRLALVMVAMLTFSLVIVGLLTVYHVVDEYRERQRDIISEKSRSVQLELEQRLEGQGRIDISDRPMVRPMLDDLSRVFFTDINIYGLDGRLISSSRPRVFKEGIMAQMMDPEAYSTMRFGQLSELVQSEQIGRLDYQAAYVPIRNPIGDTKAFLSIPYFGRQYGLQQELLSLLAPLVNIYVFLILLSVVLALVVSNRVTEPLRIIRQGLRDLRLDSTNKTIRWESKDEIGELVHEYNRTLQELVRSAELLARSERESAWREMAKQVAHEIKNPLTPMKLSIQMLQRSSKDGAQDMDERIDRTARILIEQIDTLSHIASEFSRFAQMPQAVPEVFDLMALLRDAVELHIGQGAEVSLQSEVEGEVCVRADREQLMRVFTNLLRNALQAIPDERSGMIIISVERENGRVSIAVRDNGSGIPEEVRDRVFVPNFTTKTAGMGLGLAMVQRIVEGAGGSVDFETLTDVGTTFTVRLPLANRQ
jgi:two-component system, NtrC family, nitrogen regulation sensor histidine kinase NtrY